MDFWRCEHDLCGQSLRNLTILLHTLKRVLEFIWSGEWALQNCWQIWLLVRYAHFSIYSLPAFPNSCAAPGALVTCCVSNNILVVVSSGLARS